MSFIRNSILTGCSVFESSQQTACDHDGKSVSDEMANSKREKQEQTSETKQSPAYLSCIFQ